MSVLMPGRKNKKTKLKTKAKTWRMEGGRSGSKCEAMNPAGFEFSAHP